MKASRAASKLMTASRTFIFLNNRCRATAPSMTPLKRLKVSQSVLRRGHLPRIEMSPLLLWPKRSAKITSKERLASSKVLSVVVALWAGNKILLWLYAGLHHDISRF